MKRITLTKTAIALIAASSLTACGGGGVKGFSFESAPKKAVSANTSPENSYTISSNSSGTSVIRNGSIISTASDQYVTDKVDNISIHRRGSFIKDTTARANSNRVFAFASARDGATLFGASSDGAVVGRQTASEIPTAGVAKYTGDYNAILIGNPGTFAQSTDRFIHGKSEINVDFNQNQVAGKITNRETYSTSGLISTARDVTIQK